jgi:hypothetical protein
VLALVTLTCPVVPAELFDRPFGQLADRWPVLPGPAQPQPSRFDHGSEHDDDGAEVAAGFVDAVVGFGVVVDGPDDDAAEAAVASLVADGVPPAGSDPGMATVGSPGIVTGVAPGSVAAEVFVAVDGRWTWPHQPERSADAERSTNAAEVMEVGASGLDDPATVLRSVPSSRPVATAPPSSPMMATTIATGASRLRHNRVGDDMTLFLQLANCQPRGVYDLGIPVLPLGGGGDTSCHRHGW